MFQCYIGGYHVSTNSSQLIAPVMMVLAKASAYKGGIQTPPTGFSTFASVFPLKFDRSTTANPVAGQFSCLVMFDPLRPHGLQHTRPPCPSPTLGVYPNSCPWSQWCHPTISSSVVPFFCLQSFPASGSFQMSQFLASGGRSIGASSY